MKQLNKLLLVEILNLIFILNKVDLNDYDPIMVAMSSRHSVMECVIVMSYQVEFSEFISQYR